MKILLFLTPAQSVFAIHPDREPKRLESGVPLAARRWFAMQASIVAAWGMLWLGPAAAPAATYHVAQQSPQAADDGPGTGQRPWKTISKAAEMAEPGDAVLIHAGTYREHVRPAHSGTAAAPITYEAAPGEEVILTGADLVTGWTAVGGGIWKKEPWTHRFPTHPNDSRHRLVGRCEQVIVDGRLLAQAEGSESMAPGSFFADPGRKTLLVRLPRDRDPNQATVEASVRSVCFGSGWGGAVRDFIIVRGITVRFAANTAQRGRCSCSATTGSWKTAAWSGPTATESRFTATT